MRHRSIISDKHADVQIKQMHNGEEERLVLTRFPFHEGMTVQSVLLMYGHAVQYLLQIVPYDQQISVMGRFSRKLVKRMQQLKKAREQ